MSGAAAPKYFSEAKAPRIRPEMVRPENSEGFEHWTEIGEFSRACGRCGAVRDDLVFLLDPKRKSLYVYPAPCSECDPKTLAQDRHVRATEAAMAMLQNPPNWLISKVRQKTGLPERLHAGLHWLKRTEQNTPAIDAALAMVSRFETGERDARAQGLYLWGPVGCGKTAIAKALAFELRLRTGPITPEGWDKPVMTNGTRAVVLWWPVAQLFSEMQRSWDGAETRYSEGEIERADVLCLDDLGKQRETEHTRATLLRLVDLRIENLRAHVITSNWSPRQMHGRMLTHGCNSADAAAFVDRILGSCDVVEVTGESWRGRG